MISFNTNCTLPNSTVNYVSQPSSRGTLDILWSCLQTILLCTWSIQHPTIPRLRSSDNTRSKIKDAATRFKWMIFTLLAPEGLLLKAVIEWQAARSMTTALKNRAVDDNAAWSNVHSYFLNMGGFVIHFKNNTPEPLPNIRNINSNAQAPGVVQKPGHHQDPVATPILTEAPKLETDVEKAIALTKLQNTTKEPLPSGSEQLRIGSERLYKILRRKEQGFPKSGSKNTVLVQQISKELKVKAFAGQDMGQPFLDLLDTFYNLVRLREEYWAVDGPQLAFAREIGIISSIPALSESEIEDKSSADFAVKFLAIAYTLWQIIQLIIRYGKGYPSSQIEVVTVAFAACAVCTYILWWNKPQDVKTPFVIEATRYATKEEILLLARKGPNYFGGLFGGYAYTMPEHITHKPLDGHNEIGEGALLGVGFATLFGTLFGMIHLLAWNFEFPTLEERNLWRIASIMTSATPLLLSILHALWLMAFRDLTKEKARNGLARIIVLIIRQVVIPILEVVMGILYVGARSYQLVETCRSLFYLTPDTFQSI